MEILREPPKASSFVPLIEHQSATPASFYSGPPVLHYYSDRSKLIVLEHEARSVPAFAPLLEHPTSSQEQQPQQQPHANGTEAANGGSDEARGTHRVVDNVDVWVTSDKLFLYSNDANAGLSIPYPSISLHAIQSLPQPSPGEQQGLYMQIISFPSTEESAAAAQDEDVEPDSISVTVIPTASAPPQVASASGDGLEGEDQPEQTPVVAMFNALSACSNLHPDPVEDEEGEDAGGSRLFRAGLAFPGSTDGGLPPAMPGSGGWITAENMDEFFDAEGNWIGDDEQEDQEEESGDEPGAAASGEPPLGPGAGTVRPRQDTEEQGNGDGADGAGEAEETKWRRTS
ncbi:uncharacterized protein Z520_10171 [Fonsecaea multimorphosa CBS 102226]|uniref:Regulator of volume decrease after cellular swelling-domain-containing protein n=1 Tax=Fonsecaea multimorphosa CBS 102226 TaxID=1442371 RepID=A0A0D2GX17_9EURO|nr:uncharacterized protein Z520_10171 [Fonsecaea multimorphosa CBS 102226]KIX94145.1 hypothetical protein Z520_10171 [Fonsecaea multimorphosa CBS 102226]OAL19498.1 hypothetical protein AYO22_09660 [Fonsecaea multimorphosa]